MLRNMLAAGSLLAAFSVFAPAQQPRGTASQRTAPADTGDFIEGNLKFHRATSGFFQVTDTEKNQAAGTVILQAGGAPMFAPLPGYDIKAAYEKHMNGSASGSVQTARGDKDEGPSPTQTPDPIQAPGFDAATKTATLPDGRAVTFIDDENLKVQIRAAAGAQTFDLHYHGGKGAAGVLHTWERGVTGKSGMSFTGSGVTITLESANGMPGGQLFDTSQGGNLGNRGALDARVGAIVKAVREASDAAPPALGKSKVVKSLLANNMGLGGQ
jgi:hypothetical protein